jgi:hypothetical protein
MGGGVERNPARGGGTTEERLILFPGHEFTNPKRGRDKVQG